MDLQVSAYIRIFFFFTDNFCHRNTQDEEVQEEEEETISLIQV
jgi:hypothetical protein